MTAGRRPPAAGRTIVRLDEGADVDVAALVAAVEQAGEYKARLAG